MKANEIYYFSNLFGKVLYMFQTCPLSISVLADTDRTSMTTTYCVYTVMRYSL